MCIDYTSLNKACPKDEYPLPRICQIVDSTTSCELLSFLDAYSGYHQISLAVDDEEKTAFITLFGIFCYTKMAFIGTLKTRYPRVQVPGQDRRQDMQITHPYVWLTSA
jgi:hypothetical protein